MSFPPSKTKLTTGAAGRCAWLHLSFEQYRWTYLDSHVRFLFCPNAHKDGFDNLSSRNDGSFHRPASGNECGSIRDRARPFDFARRHVIHLHALFVLPDPTKITSCSLSVIIDNRILTSARSLCLGKFWSRVFNTLPHLQIPMAARFVAWLVNFIFVMACPTSWTMPLLYPFVTMHASTHRRDLTSKDERWVYLIWQLHRWCHWWSPTPDDRSCWSTCYHRGCSWSVAAVWSSRRWRAASRLFSRVCRSPVEQTREGTNGEVKRWRWCESRGYHGATFQWSVCRIMLLNSIVLHCPIVFFSNSPFVMIGWLCSPVAITEMVILAGKNDTSGQSTC